jgi:formylglycine-generating enzyme required for sulfatase activity
MNACDRKPSPLQEVAAAACQGKGISQAAEYEGGPGPHYIVLLSTSGEPHRWSNDIPDTWSPSNIGSTELVVCVGNERRRSIETCAYTGGGFVERLVREIDVTVVEASTGAIVAQETLRGGNPRSCSQTVWSDRSDRTDSIEGSRVKARQVLDFLRPIVTGESATTETTPTPLIEQMVLIPAGTFEMGSESGDTAESPVHTVHLDDYYIDVYEVTNGSYKACVDAMVCAQPHPRRASSDINFAHYWSSTYDNYPVIYVSWKDANTYCEWREARLPTEAEWEKAARGGLEGTLYPWGNTFDGSLANFCDSNCPKESANPDFDDGYAVTAPVGSYSPNGYGLYDMVGNVSEWVADWYAEDYYRTLPADVRNPLGPDTGSFRVMRGGSWYYQADWLGVANRTYAAANYTFDGVGFRCARSP